MEHQHNELSIEQVTDALDGAGLTYQIRGRYIVSQCPLHNDKNASCQIFLDDWFASCLAGCGRFPIVHAFPALRAYASDSQHNPTIRRAPIETTRQYQTYDLMADFARLPFIPRHHVFKNLPLPVLDELGWRWDEPKQSYFIPYFNQDRTKIPFAQWRHLTGSRRFTFLAGARPRLYGIWNVTPGARLFIVEGASDAAVLEHSMVPWVAVPSASLGSMLEAFAKDSIRLGIKLVYAGDQDSAGEALRAALDRSGASYRVNQPPGQFKDWGEFYEAEGGLAVYLWCYNKLWE